MVSDRLQEEQVKKTIDQVERQREIARQVVRELKGSRPTGEPPADYDARRIVDEVMASVPKGAFKFKGGQN